MLNVREKSIKFEHSTDLFDEFSSTELKDELEEIFVLWVIQPEHLMNEIKEKHNINIYRNSSSKKKRTEGYYMFLLGFAQSPFHNFESLLRIVLGLDEDDIQLIL